MTRTRLIVASLAVSALAGPTLFAQDVTYEVKDGVRYQITRQVVQHPISETRYEQRRYTVNRERYTTDMQTSQRTYQVPVTQQQWVPGYQRTWNLFAPPVLSYRLLPVTRLETRSETVRIPVTRRDLIPEEQVQQVPVTTQRLVPGEIVSRVPVGVEPSSSVATSSGGTRLSSDPPRAGTANNWRPADGTSAPR